MENKYHPVPCALHSDLELLIMHGKKIELSIKTGVMEKKVVLRPSDIVSRKDQGEYLLAKGEDETSYEIRLDHIIKYKQA